MDPKEPLTPQDGTQEPGTPEITPENDPQLPNDPTPPEAGPQTPAIDYEKKFAESTREAQILAQRLKESEERINLISNPSLPNEDELRKVFPQWDNYSDEMKEAKKDIYQANKQISNLSKTIYDTVETSRWNDDLSKVASRPEFSELKGREDEFKKFCYKPTHKGVSIEVLAKSFLFDIKTSPAPVNNPTPTPGLERGSGGPRDTKLENPKLTVEQVATLRKNDPKRYQEMILSGAIKPEDLI